MSKNTNLSFLTDYITADITNGRIGINTPSPTVAFDVVGTSKFSDNVGINTTAPTWFTNFKGINLANGSFVSYSTNGSVFLTQNSYFNAAGSWTYINTGTAGQYSINGTGEHLWYTAVSGTAGTATSLSERMRILANGNVGIGNTGFANTRLTITGISTTSSNFGLVVNNSSNANLFSVRDDGLVSANVVNANSFYSATGYSYPTVNVWTTFYTMAAERGIYSVIIGLGAEGFAEWQAYGTIFCQSSIGAFSTLYNSSLVQMRTSGLNIQVLLAPGAGFTRELTFKVLRS